MHPESTLAWILFNVFVILMLMVDLFLHRRDHTVGMKEALVWSAIWTVVALGFNVFVYYWLGSKAALEFFTGYLIERSLSVDNLFVFLLVFSYFAVPSKYQRKVLFWGIFGALVMRAIFIAAGLTLIQNFKWVIYVFGGFLIYTGIKMATHDEKEIHPEKNIVIKLFRKFMPVTNNYVEGKFFTKQNGRIAATPLFIVLLVVETTDVVFAPGATGTVRSSSRPSAPRPFTCSKSSTSSPERSTRGSRRRSDGSFVPASPAPMKETQWQPHSKLSVRPPACDTPGATPGLAPASCCQAVSSSPSSASR